MLPFCSLDGSFILRGLGFPFCFLEPNLKTEFRKMLTESDWMDPKTQAEAEKKMDKMISTVGYPEEGFI